MTNGDSRLKVCERILREIVGGEYPLCSVIHRPALALERSPSAGEESP